MSSTHSPRPNTHNTPFHGRLVDNPDAYPDLFFEVQEGQETTEKKISAHYSLVKIRYPQIVESAVYKKRKGYYVSIKKEQAFPSHASSLIKVLVYVYSGELDLTNLGPFKAVEILAVAQSYNMTNLIQVLKKFLQDHLNLQNVFKLLKYSSDLRLSDLKLLCINFAMQNTDFFTSSDAEFLGLELFQEVISALLFHYKSGTKALAFDVKINASDTIGDDLRNLHSQLETLEIDYKYSQEIVSFQIHEKIIKVHRFILSCLSEEFDAILKKFEATSKAIKHITLDPKYDEICSNAFQAMVQYIYYRGTKDVSLLYSCQLLEFAKDFKLQKLINMLETVMLEKEITPEAAPLLLRVVYTQLAYNKNLEVKLRNKALAYVVENMDKIDYTSFDSLPAIVGADILRGIQQAIKINKSNYQIIIEGGTLPSPTEQSKRASTHKRVHSKDSTSLSPRNKQTKTKNSPRKLSGGETSDAISSTKNKKPSKTTVSNHEKKKDDGKREHKSKRKNPLATSGEINEGDDKSEIKSEESSKSKIKVSNTENKKIESPKEKLSPKKKEKGSEDDKGKISPKEDQSNDERVKISDEENGKPSQNEKEPDETGESS